MLDLRVLIHSGSTTTLHTGMRNFSKNPVLILLIKHPILPKRINYKMMIYDFTIAMSSKPASPLLRLRHDRQREKVERRGTCVAAEPDLKVKHNSTVSLAQCPAKFTSAN